MYPNFHTTLAAHYAALLAQSTDDTEKRFRQKEYDDHKRLSNDTDTDILPPVRNRNASAGNYLRSGRTGKEKSFFISSWFKNGGVFLYGCQFSNKAKKFLCTEHQNT